MSNTLSDIIPAYISSGKITLLQCLDLLPKNDLSSFLYLLSIKPTKVCYFTIGATIPVYMNEIETWIVQVDKKSNHSQLQEFIEQAEQRGNNVILCAPNPECIAPEIHSKIRWLATTTNGKDMFITDKQTSKWCSFPDSFPKLFNDLNHFNQTYIASPCDIELRNALFTSLTTSANNNHSLITPAHEINSTATTVPTIESPIVQNANDLYQQLWQEQLDAQQQQLNEIYKQQQTHDEQKNITDPATSVYEFMYSDSSSFNSTNSDSDLQNKPATMTHLENVQLGQSLISTIARLRLQSKL